jgi:hypothetical protein
MAIQLQITIDCANPAQLAEFWAAALHYKVQDPPTGFASWEVYNELEVQNIPQSEWGNFSAIVDPEEKGSRIFFQRVPESKTVKNRLHLDLNASKEVSDATSLAKVEAAVARLTGLGARELYRMETPHDFWVTMADPEGNEFCIQ